MVAQTYGGTVLKAIACHNGVASIPHQATFTRLGAGGGQAPSPQTPTRQARTVSYQPDDAGNRLSVTADGMATGYQLNGLGLNQYQTVGGQWVTNGSAHEIAAYQNVSYQYLGDTRLRRASSASAGVYELGYDALGRCVRRTSNGVSTYYIYDGNGRSSNSTGAATSPRATPTGSGSMKSWRATRAAFSIIRTGWGT